MKMIRPTAALVMDSPIGPIRLEELDGKLFRLALPGTFGSSGPVSAATPFLQRVCSEINEYFEGKRFSFDFECVAVPKRFQSAVLAATTAIPYGETRSYGWIAAQIGHPGAARAVGTALHNNPVAIVIPCHRVIGSNGKLTGFGGGLPVKDFLLKMEKTNLEQKTCF